MSYYREFNLRLHRGRFHDVIRVLDLLNKHGERSYVIGSVFENLPQLLSRIEELESRVEALERGRAHSVGDGRNSNHNHSHSSNHDSSSDPSSHSHGNNNRGSPGVVGSPSGDSKKSIESALSSLWQG
jgi:hypothetical protein